MHRLVMRSARRQVGVFGVSLVVVVNLGCWVEASLAVATCDVLRSAMVLNNATLSFEVCIHGGHHIDILASEPSDGHFVAPTLHPDRYSKSHVLERSHI